MLGLKYFSICALQCVYPFTQGLMYDVGAFVFIVQLSPFSILLLGILHQYLSPNLYFLYMYLYNQVYMSDSVSINLILLLVSVCSHNTLSVSVEPPQCSSML